MPFGMKALTLNFHIKCYEPGFKPTNDKCQKMQLIKVLLLCICYASFFAIKYIFITIIHLFRIAEYFHMHSVTECFHFQFYLRLLSQMNVFGESLFVGNLTCL